MNKNSFSYSDLSNKELESLKEFYIQKKIESMSHKELKEFALEIISHQITNTIGKEEEIEAWKEISEFFGDEFDIIINRIQTKYKDVPNIKDNEIDLTKKRQDLLESNNLDQKKEDMWDD